MAKSRADWGSPTLIKIKPFRAFFLLLFAGVVFAYQGGTIKNHNHTSSAGDGGQLSNLSVSGTLTATGGAVSLSSTTITGTLNISSTTTVAAGVAATDAAQFGQIPVTTNWTAYTPTITGVGTASSVVFFYKRVGDTVYVKGVFTTGTCTASNVSITTPGSFTINAAHANIDFLLGYGERILTAAGPTTHAAANFLSAWYDGTNNNLVFLSIQSGSNNFTKNGGTTLFSNLDTAAVFFDYPI